jgi:hypothetical protein
VLNEVHEECLIYYESKPQVPLEFVLLRMKIMMLLLMDKTLSKKSSSGGHRQALR